MGNEFWAAIAGSIVGGFAAGLIQFLTLRHQISEESKRQQQRNQALGRSLIFKLMRLASTLHTISEHLHQAKLGAPPNAEAWTYTLPIANLPDSVSISADEAALVIGDGDTTNEILDLEAIHASSLKLLQVYGEQRKTLSDFLAPASFANNVGSIELDANQLAALRPRMIELNSLLEGLEKRSREDANLGRKVLNDTLNILAKRYDLSLKVRMKATP